MRAVWSSKMPLASTPAVLNLLDGLVGIDPAFHIVWSRFRMMRRYLAHCPDEEPRIFRMLDLISRCAQVCPGPRSYPSFAYLCCCGGVCLGWGGEGLGSGFSSSIEDDDGSCSAFLIVYFGCLAVLYFCQVARAEGVCWELNLLILKDLYNYLPLPICGYEIKCC